MEENNKLDEWLKLPQELEQVSAPEGFKAKVMERIQAAESEKDTSPSVKMLDFSQWSKTWQVAAVIAFLVANVSVLYTYTEQQNQEEAELFAESLGMSQTSTSEYSLFE